MQNPVAVMTMENGSKVVIELYPSEAPNAVTSFIWLANRGLFDNRAIKRVVHDWVVQPSSTSFDGDPECEFSLEGEFEANGHKNDIKFEKGTVGMGGDGVRYSSGSCFFFALSTEACARLNGKYTGFGKVIEGFEEIERIAAVKTIPRPAPEGVSINEPVVPEIIASIRVETFGEVYGEPVKVQKE